MSKPTLWNWVSSGLPKAPESNGVTRVDLRQAVAWLIGYYRDQVKQEQARARAAADQSRNRTGSAKADLIELELAEKRGQMIRIEAHWRILLAWKNQFVAAFRQKPAAWAQACQGEPAVKIRELMDRELGSIFDELNRVELPDNVPDPAAAHFRAALTAIDHPTTTTQEPAHVRPSPNA